MFPLSRARQSLMDVCHQIRLADLLSPQITFTGLSDFGNKVLYMDPVKDAHLDVLTRISEICREIYEKNGISSSDVRGFNPHLTLFKLSKAPELYRKGVKKIDPCWSSKYTDHHFGIENMQSLHLCNMMNKQQDGYYEIFHEEHLSPKPPNYTLKLNSHNLFWLPANSADESPIPFMFYSPRNSNKKIEYFIIFCHGNGCDIGSMQYTLHEFSKYLNVYIISFEYPSYGLCTAESPNQQTINNHGDRTFRFVRDILQWPTERIILYGHSVGSGVACYLSSTQPIGALILQSPYTSISNLVREKVGVLSLLVSTRSWDNLEAMKQITCPVIFIHGLNDTLIPSNHSQILYDACLNNEGKKIILLRNEDHNSMTETTLLKYITPFLEKLYKSMNTNIVLPIVKINEELRVPPQPFKTNNETSSNNNIFSSLYSMSRASTAATMSTLRSISRKQENEVNENGTL